MDAPYLLIESAGYQSLVAGLVPKLAELGGNFVSFKNEIHRSSRFAICQYDIQKNEAGYALTYDHERSLVTSHQKKTYADPKLLDNCDVRNVLSRFLNDIDDATISRAEVKLIQTDSFPFIFNPHRDSQFRRLRHIRYLATVIVSVDGIDGGNMQLFHSENDKIGPFTLIEELEARAGVGYIVDETRQLIFHGMKPAHKQSETAHRGALLIRFF